MVIDIKLKFIVVLGLLLALFCLSSCQKTEIFVDVENSFYADFKVSGDKVYICCELMIKNLSDEEKNITLTASFDSDVKNGLLKEAILEGYLADCDDKVFVIKKGNNLVRVVFIGEFAGKNEKSDRLLPSIQINQTE